MMKKAAMAGAMGIGLLIALLLSMFLIIASDDEGGGSNSGLYIGVNLSAEVLVHQPMVEKYARQNGISDYVYVLLAIIQVESEGKLEDVMQSSESAGLPMNTLGTEDSIKQGCKYFAELVTKADKLGCDMDAVIQAYNYGSAFLDFVAKNGKRYTFELAQEFSRQHSGGVKVTYKNAISTPINGGWRYNYGNMFYVKLVKQYLTQTGGDALGTDAQNRIVEVARNSEKYGISAAGGYCEAWAEEVYRKAGVSIDQHCCAGKNRALYTVGKSSKNIPLGAMVYNDPAVYQSRTNDTCGRNAGHVGIYIGKGQIISNIGGTVIDTVEGWTAYYGFGGWGWGGAVVAQK